MKPLGPRGRDPMRVRALIGAIAVLGVAAALFFWRADPGGSPQPDAGAVLDVLADAVEEASLAEVARE